VSYDVLDGFRQLARYAVEEGVSAATLRAILDEECRSIGSPPAAYWTRDSAIAAAVEFAESSGCLPGRNDLCARNGLPARSTVTRLFGSWDALVVEAGLESSRRAA
jgi:hypothetical protein